MVHFHSYDGCAVSQSVAGKIPQDFANHVPNVELNAHTKATLATRYRSFTVASRLDVQLDDAKDAYYLNGTCPSMKLFDVIAVTPGTEKLFAQCCEKLGLYYLPWLMPYAIKEWVRVQCCKKLGLYNLPYSIKVEGH